MRRYYYPVLILVPLANLALPGCAPRSARHSGSATFWASQSHSLKGIFEGMPGDVLRIDPPVLSKVFLSADSVPAGQDSYVHLIVSFNDTAAPHQMLGTPEGAETATKHLTQKIALLKQFVIEIDSKGYTPELRKLMHHDVTCECDMGCYCQGGDGHPCHGCGVDLKACGRVGPGERDQMRTMAMGSDTHGEDDRPGEGNPDPVGAEHGDDDADHDENDDEGHDDDDDHGEDEGHGGHNGGGHNMHGMSLTALKCPVTGEPIGMTHRVPTEDGPVFFCCEDCIRKYRADPAKYATGTAAQARSIHEGSERMPLNICLVVDVSGSMKGAKIGQIREMVGVVADNMRQGDSLSLVTFANRPKVRLRGTTLAQREQIKKLVGGLAVGGGTNIYAGLQKGYEVLQDSFHAQAMNRLLLLSDGKDNKSRRSLEDYSVLSTGAVKSGISTSSFGVGTDFSETLLEIVADWRTGNTGRYHYIQDPEMIAMAVSMDVFMASQARNVRIGIFLDGARAEDVGLGLVRESDTSVFGNLKHIGSMMRKAVVAKLQVPATDQADINIGRIEVKYTNAQGQACVEERTLSVKAVADILALKQAEHRDVCQSAAIEEVRSVLSKCILQLDNKETLGALRTLGSAIRNMQSLLSSS